MRIIYIGTMLWIVAALCALSACAHAATAYFTMTPDDPGIVIYLRSFLLAFLPWLFAFASTRVLYGIEQAMEN